MVVMFWEYKIVSLVTHLSVNSSSTQICLYITRMNYVKFWEYTFVSPFTHLLVNSSFIQICLYITRMNYAKLWVYTLIFASSALAYSEGTGAGKSILWIISAKYQFYTDHSCPTYVAGFVIKFILKIITKQATRKSLLPAWFNYK